MKVIFLMLYGLFLADTAFCTDYDVEICNLQAVDTGRILIQPCDGWESVTTCGNGWIRWESDTAGSQAMLSAALFAFAAHKNITVRIDESADCNGYDKTTIIRVN